VRCDRLPRRHRIPRRHLIKPSPDRWTLTLVSGTVHLAPPGALGVCVPTFLGLDAPEKEGFILKRFAGAIFTGALVIGGLVGMSAPALAVTTFTTCSTVDAHAHLTPGLSNTPHVQSIHATGTISGCVGGGVTGGSVTIDLSTTSPNTCSSLSTNNPGAVIAANSSATAWKITWNTAQVSQGSAKIKDGADVVHKKAILTVKSGKFVGTPSNPTKGKVTVSFLPSSGQSCPTLTDADASNHPPTCSSGCTPLKFTSKT
jgi:hypothetical protein